MCDVELCSLAKSYYVDLGSLFESGNDLINARFMSVA
jgi:hypothetical protein